MAENWNALRLSDVLPKEALAAVQEASSLATQVTSLAKTTLEIQRTIASLIPGDAGINPAEMAIEAVLQLVQAILRAARVHVLFVPIPKITPNPQPNRAVPATLNDLAYSLGYDAEQVGLAFSSAANNAYASLSQMHDGGNAAFFKTVVESVYDELDPNRPQYPDPSDAVACVAILAGAPSMSSLLLLATAFNKLFQPESSLASRIVPVPQNVRTKPIVTPRSSRLSVRVEWDRPKAIYESPYFPGVMQRVKKYAVIRSSSPTAARARTVLDFFPTRDLTEGRTNANGTSKVVAVGTAMNGSFVDVEALDVNLTYYYCVAWQVEVTEGDATVTLPWDLVSAVQKVSPKRVPVANRGVPPDWVSREYPLALFPDAAAVVQGLLNKIASIAEQVKQPSQADQIVAAINVVLRNVETQLTRIGAISEQVSSIAGALLSDVPSLYTTEFHGLGGTAFLLSELATRLNDKSDTSRPPFDNNEYVMGVLIVAGGPRLSDIMPTVAMLQMLFASPQADDPVAAALNAIEGLVDEATAQTFGPDGMSPPVEGTDPATGFPVAAPAGSAVADDGTVVAADDPRNPEAGFTNDPDPNADPC